MATFEEVNAERAKRDKVQGYKQILAGIEATEHLRKAVHMARDAFLVNISSDATIYVARLAGELDAAREQLEADLGLAETTDEHGRLILEVGQRFVHHSSTGMEDMGFALGEIIHEDYVEVNWDSGDIGVNKSSWVWNGLRDGTIEQVKE